MCVLLIVVGRAHAPEAIQAQARARADERDVKAAFLFNFTQFVEWPDASFAAAQSPFVIGVLGDNPFGPVLDAVVRGETVKGHPLAVQSFKTLATVTACQILFVSTSEASRLKQVFSALQGRPILTVSDLPGFASRGGIIGFTTEQGRVRMQVNLEAARAAGLTMSSGLLQAATIVSGGVL